MKKLLAVLTLLIIFCFEINAQKTVTIPGGTLIVVKAVTNLDSDKLIAGQEVVCTVALDVEVDGDTVIKAGSPVFCLVQDAEASGMVGQGGALTIAFQHTIAVDGKNVHLTGNFIAKGESSTGEKVAIGVILCPFALLCKGEEAGIPAGTQSRAFTIGDIKVKVESKQLIEE